jgi:signal transduction histidine kinase
MLHDFLTANKAEVIRRCSDEVARRSATGASATNLEHGIPRFLDQLIETLQLEQTSNTSQGVASSAPTESGPVASEIASTAAWHGRELSQQGFTVDQVVHNYGDLCQVITGLAVERDVRIASDEFRTLNRCLDDGIADAVTEFVFQRNCALEKKSISSTNEQLGFLAHELRNLIYTATLAVKAIRAGTVGSGGATGALLDRCLIGMRNLVDQSLADVRTIAEMPSRAQLFSLADMISDVRIAASLEARMRGCRFTVGDVDPGLAILVDRDIIMSAVGNLLTNAFKFTRPDTEVSLNAFACADRIQIDVADHCGGLAATGEEEVFLPFKQRSADRSGSGLGLAISRRGVEANHGLLRVRNIPASGCVFTIDLPRHLLAEKSVLNVPISKP